MKKLLFLLSLISLPLLSYSQLTTINPDTVCFGSVNSSIYQVTNTLGLTYNWTIVAPGAITSGQGTNQITVDWSNANPGLIPNAVQVQASNATGCLSPLLTLNVFIYDVNPTFTQINDLCDGSPCQNLIANPQGGIWTGTGVVNSTFCPNNSGIGSFNLTYTYSDGGCDFTTIMNVNVIQLPILSPIEHD
ncbi:hypothetical protein EBU71_17895 [bacterium]|nr:hypothetical protein [Candidatus Elulimicrobium humile]